MEDHRAGAATSVPPRLWSVTVAAGVVAIVGAVVLVGWFTHLAAVTRLAPGLPTMKANTALCLFLLAVSLLARGRWWRAGPAVVVAVVVAVTVAEFATDRQWIDEALVHDTVSTSGVPGQMAPITAACLGTLAVVLVLLAVRRLVVVAQVLATATVLVGFTAVLTYLYGPDALFELRPFATVAVHTAVAVVVLGLAALAAVPDGVLRWALAPGTARGIAVRWFAPTVLVALPLTGYLVLRGQRAGLYRPEFGLVIALVVTVALLLGNGLLTARSVGRIESRASRVVDTMPVGYLRVDAELRVAAMNSRAADAVVGIPGQAVGSRLAEVLPRGSARAVEDAARRVLRTGRPETVSIYRPRTVDTWFQASLHAADDGVEIYLVDVTSERAAQQLVQEAALRDHRLATALQAALFPPLPELDDLTIAVRHVIGEGRDHLHGAWYEAVVQPDGSMSVSVGDADARGAGAAASMTQLRALIATAGWDASHPPSETLRRVDAVAARRGETATAVLARLQPAAAGTPGWVLTWSNAGHVPPILVAADGGVTVLDDGVDRALGHVVDGADQVVRRDRRHHVDDGCTIVLSSRASSWSAEEWGAARAAVSSHSARTVDDLVDTVVSHRPAASSTDDLVVLALRPGSRRRVGVVELPFDSSASGAARRFILDRTTGAADDAVDDLLLIASELVTNALIHGLPPVLLRLAVEPDHLQVEITDGGAMLPPTVAPSADTRQSHGRGLMLVEGLSAGWGAVPGPTGKTVWARVGAGDGR